MGLDREITTTLDGLGSALREAGYAAQGAAPTEQRILDALGPHLESTNDHSTGVAVAHEVARWAQAVLDGPANKLRATRVKLQATRRRIRDAEARAGAARRALEDANQVVAAEIQTAIKAWGG